MNSEGIKQSIRQRNSGGVLPNAQHHVTKLVIGLLRLHQLYPTPKHSKIISPYDRALLYFLYLWLTGALSECTASEDIPNITVVSGSQPCQAHRFRKIRESSPSWVEYALPYHTINGTSWQWQPLPNGLNQWFLHAFSQSGQNEHTWIMSSDEKVQFLAFINKKWRTPKALRGHYQVKRNTLFKYFSLMIHRDAQLPTPSKVVCLGEDKLHHKSAIAYQQRSSNQIRHDIFLAQTRYIERLHKALPDALIPYLSAYKAKTHVKSNIFSKDQYLQRYLTTPGSITSFRYDITRSARQYIPIPEITIGSVRQLSVDSLRRFFHTLDEQGKRLECHKHSLNSLRELHNFRACELALLLIVLTGTRPTHAITIERSFCYAYRHAIVYDKGYYRPIWLCDHLHLALRRYDVLQDNFFRRLSQSLHSDLMWFEIDETMAIVPLSAQCLKKFMTQWGQMANLGPDTDPYQLRHFFAQHALNSPSPTLTTTDIDRLMGHANFGERLGSDTLFPVTQHKLHRFLNQIADFLHLVPIKDQ